MLCTRNIPIPGRWPASVTPLVMTPDGPGCMTCGTGTGPARSSSARPSACSLKQAPSWAAASAILVCRRPSGEVDVGGYRHLPLAGIKSGLALLQKVNGQRVLSDREVGADRSGKYRVYRMSCGAQIVRICMWWERLPGGAPMRRWDGLGRMRLIGAQDCTLSAGLVGVGASSWLPTPGPGAGSGLMNSGSASGPGSGRGLSARCLRCRGSARSCRRGCASSGAWSSTLAGR